MSNHFPQIIYYTGHDGQRLAARVWQRDNAIADVVCLHGIISHGGWYESSSAHLASEGFQVHFLERRGSGLNAGNRGDVDQWTTWLADVAEYLRRLPRDRPKIVLGISWGGILATALARRHPELLDGFGLICPGLCSSKAANAFQRLALRIAAGIGLNGFRVEVPLRDPALFTHSIQAQRYVGQDPLALREITVRFAICNLALLRYAMQAPEQIRVPVLLMLASKDPITDNARTRRFVGRMGDPEPTIIEYPDASHTLEFEEDPSRYFQDLSDWCKRVVDRGDAKG